MRPHKAALLMQQFMKHMPIVENIMADDQYMDDAWRYLNAIGFVQVTLEGGEIFVCSTEGVIGAMLSIRDINHQRWGYFEAWADPSFRNFKGNKSLVAYSRELVEYAFEPWPKGLGLQKLKADIAADNAPALAATRNMNFVEIGRSPLGTLHHGVPSDTVMLELLNPKFFDVGALVGDLQIGQGRRGQGSPDTDLHAAGAVCVAPGTEFSGAPGDITIGDSPVGDRDGEPAGLEEEPGAELAELEQSERGDEPAGAPAVRTKLRARKRSTSSRKPVKPGLQ